MSKKGWTLGNKLAAASLVVALISLVLYFIKSDEGNTVTLSGNENSYVGRDQTIIGTQINNYNADDYDYRVQVPMIGLNYGGIGVVELVADPIEGVQLVDCEWSSEPSGHVFLTKEGACKAKVEYTGQPYGEFGPTSRMNTSIIVFAKAVRDGQVVGTFQQQMGLINMFSGEIVADKDILIEGEAVEISLVSKDTGEVLPDHFSCNWKNAMGVGRFKIESKNKSGCKAQLSITGEKPVDVSAMTTREGIEAAIMAKMQNIIPSETMVQVDIVAHGKRIGQAFTSIPVSPSLGEGGGR